MKLKINLRGYTDTRTYERVCNNEESQSFHTNNITILIYKYTPYKKRCLFLPCVYINTRTRSYTKNNTHTVKQCDDLPILPKYILLNVYYRN